jgi:hypothetical protein
MCLVSKNKHLFVRIQGMSVGGVINICCHKAMCLVSEGTKFLVTMLGTLVGTLILDALLLYGIHNVSSYYFMQFYWFLHQG